MDGQRTYREKVGLPPQTHLTALMNALQCPKELYGSSNPHPIGMSVQCRLFVVV